MRIVLASLVLVVCAASSATAQIYSWRDADGHLVVSDRPRDPESTGDSFVIPGTTTVRATRAVPTSTKSAEFDDVIEVHSAAQGVSPDLVRAVIQVESAFNPRAVSSKGAMGLMQLMPATARELGVENPFHPEDNIRGGVTYLRKLLDRYDSNIELALAAYNAGPGNVEKYNAVPPYRETQAYGKKITGATAGGTAPAAAPKPPSRVIYKWIELSADSRALVRYGNRPPAGVTASPVTGKVAPVRIPDTQPTIPFSLNHLRVSTLWRTFARFAAYRIRDQQPCRVLRRAERSDTGAGELPRRHSRLDCSNGPHPHAGVRTAGRSQVLRPVCDTVSDPHAQSRSN